MTLVSLAKEPWSHRQLKGTQRDHRTQWGSSYLQTKETWGQPLDSRLPVSSTQKPLLSCEGGPQFTVCTLAVLLSLQLTAVSPGLSCGEWE